MTEHSVTIVVPDSFIGEFTAIALLELLPDIAHYDKINTPTLSGMYNRIMDVDNPPDAVFILGIPYFGNKDFQDMWRSLTKETTVFHSCTYGESFQGSYGDNDEQTGNSLSVVHSMPPLSILSKLVYHNKCAQVIQDMFTGKENFTETTWVKELDTYMTTGNIWESDTLKALVCAWMAYGESLSDKMITEGISDMTWADADLAVISQEIELVKYTRRHADQLYENSKIIVNEETGVKTIISIDYAERLHNEVISWYNNIILPSRVDTSSSRDYIVTILLSSKRKGVSAVIRTKNVHAGSLSRAMGGGGNDNAGSAHISLDVREKLIDGVAVALKNLNY